MTAPDLRAITTVMSYYFPEVRAVISEMVRDYPHDVFLRSVSPGLDDFHEPIVEKLLRFHGPSVPALASFAHRYPTAGSEEGIREYMTMLRSSGVERIYVWHGDYEGYREVARSRGIEPIEVAFGTDPHTLAPAPWFLSNPSARDGNVLPPQIVAAVCDAGHQVFYDLSYLGSTAPFTFDVSHENIAAVAISFSKPYGLFYYRIGFTFTRRPLPSLYANKWFKNVFSLLVADRVMTKLDPGQLPTKYRPFQERVVGALAARHDLPLRASDALLLCHVAPDATLTDDQRLLLHRYRRGDGYRLCLTPYYLDPDPA